MDSSPVPPVTIRQTLREWWRDRREHHGFFPVIAELTKHLWDFLRASTPEQRRRRFGDIDFDWDNRVNTTGATVSWRNRLLGTFSSPYQASEPALFHEMIGSVPVDFRHFSFVDLGCGKGRALMLASDYPFRRIIGVELLPDLHRIAQDNLRVYKSTSQKCFDLECTCANACRFDFPEQPLLVYLFNPFLESVFAETMKRLEHSIQANPRPVFILYHNPLLEPYATRGGVFTRVAGTHQFALLASDQARSMLFPQR